MDLEAEYDNSGKVPDAPAIVAGWQRDAAAFRAAHRFADLGLPYGPTPRQTMDVFWPDGARTAPLALFIHGGYWQRMDRADFSHLAAGLLGHGVAVAMPSYDLCPAVRIGEIVAQMRAAAAFLFHRHGRRLLAIGHSAGGHLAAMLLATDWPARDPALPADLVHAALPISGLFDLAPLLHTQVNDAVRMDAAEAAANSPLGLRPNGRVHAVVGGTEGTEYTRQSRSLAEAWGGSWEAVPGANHFTVVMSLAAPDSALVARARAMVAG